jgi:hypothetical protein
MEKGREMIPPLFISRNAGSNGTRALRPRLSTRPRTPSPWRTALPKTNKASIKSCGPTPAAPVRK